MSRKGLSEGFDITSLLRFTAPKYLCKKCLALLTGTPPRSGTSVRWTSGKCPVCGVEYIAKKALVPEFNTYSESWGLALNYDDLIGHSKRLAFVAEKFSSHFQLKPEQRAEWNSYVPMRALFELLLRAQKFVHFTTYGISHIMIGALKMVAQRVPVRGVVSGVDAGVISELTGYPDEAPKLQIRTYERKETVEAWDTTPHQKIFVIDGLVAFKGSANLTISGWRKAALGRDTIEVVTDVAQVLELHNRWFSPIWGEFEDYHEIRVEEIGFENIPF